MRGLPFQLWVGSGSFLREMACLPNSGEFLEARLPLRASLCILTLIGFARNALEVALGIKVLGKWYSMDVDIVLTMMAFVPHFPFVGSAVIHWTGKKIGATVDYDKVFSFLFHLQLIHLSIPFADWAGFKLGVPYIFAGSGKYYPWFNVPVYMTLGIIVAWIVAGCLSLKVFLKYLGLKTWQGLFMGFVVLNALYWPIYHLFPIFLSTFNILTFRTLPITNFYGYAAYFIIATMIGVSYHRRHGGIRGRQGKD